MTHPTDRAEAMREACADLVRPGRFGTLECSCEILAEDVVEAIRALPLPAAPAPDAVRDVVDDGGNELGFPVPATMAFRDALKAEVAPMGADYCSWLNGYCRGWLAAERAASDEKGGECA